MHNKNDEFANKSSKRQAVDACIDFLGGVAGGTASVYIGQPLDTVKVKMQTFPALYNNAFNCFLTTFKKEGIYRGLYAGTLPSLAAQVAENSVLFLGYGLCQKMVANMVDKKKISDLNVIENATSGSLAAFFSSLVLCPTELIKCKLQAMREMCSTIKHESPELALQHKNIGPWMLTKQVLREEGVKGLFKGLVPTFIREMPGYFFFFGGYETCKILLTPEGQSKDDLGLWKTIVCGGVGGICLWTAIFPSDVIKSRVQIGLSTDNSQSFVSAVKEIIRKEGGRSLYRGLGPTLLRTFPATGGLFVAYENTKKYLSQAADWGGID
ncbi:hypothetical protein HELRODRAFT_187365 [Helobdella robusta]|uniref:Mitochondrial ornithine transporter 1 n=1 Tax=Helobdella robusta TaxID=6412 RepID=T1FP93_HELRO|nr:hypothetical protein HELRODRAFT_187365 [Helobdella robusta]ESN96828.1 hypothetical protein HELRODRAFT_187365 [Helobdella robusta]